VVKIIAGVVDQVILRKEIEALLAVATTTKTPTNQASTVPS
jgi:hypothetical protein